MTSNIIVFYDSNCGLCEHMVSFVIERDHKKLLYFSSLYGEAAKEMLGEWLSTHSLVDSVVLVEKEKIYYYSKACFRIAWHLGGFFKLPGLLSFLPEFLLYPFDLLYRLVAKGRRGFCSRLSLKGMKEKYPDRFLA